MHIHKIRAQTQNLTTCGAMSTSLFNSKQHMTNSVTQLIGENEIKSVYISLRFVVRRWDIFVWLARVIKSRVIWQL